MECYVEIPFKYYDIFYQHLWTILSREDESQHKLELFYLLSLPFNSAQEINNEFRGKMIIPQVFSVNKMHREFSSDNDWKGFRKRITFCFGYWLHGTIFYSNLLKGLFSKLEFIGYFIKSSRPENKYRIFYLKNIICFIFDWKVQTPCPITHKQTTFKLIPNLDSNQNSKNACPVNINIKSSNGPEIKSTAGSRAHPFWKAI